MIDAVIVLRDLTSSVEDLRKILGRMPVEELREVSDRAQLLHFESESLLL